MKKLMLMIGSLMGLMDVFVSEAFAQGNLWVSSGGAKLKADRKASSATIAQLPVGEKLNVISSERRWYKVATASGKKGWIYRGKVSNSAPEVSPEDGDDLFGDIPGTSISAESADTSRSIRGLSPEAKEYAKSTKTPKKYQNALDKVLALKVKKNELEFFLAMGKVGEYAD